MDRFSLLLLEPSEIYFEDFKVVYHTNPEEKSPSVHNEIPGRLKVKILEPRVVIDILWIRAIGEAEPWLECSRAPP